MLWYSGFRGFESLRLHQQVLTSTENHVIMESKAAGALRGFAKPFVPKGIRFDSDALRINSQYNQKDDRL